MRDSGISIAGGRGGEHARTEDIERAAALLRGAAEDVRRASSWAAMRVGRLEGGAPGLVGADPIAIEAAAEATEWVNRGPGGARAVALEIDDIADGLAETVRLLADAERGSLSLLDRARRAGASVGEILVAARWVTRVAAVPATVLLPDGAEEAAFGPPPEWTAVLRPEVVQGALGTADTLTGFDLVRLLASFLASAAMACDALLGDPHGLLVIPVARRDGRGPEGVSRLMSRIRDASPGGSMGGEGSRVVVERITHKDGSTAVIVEIPGTQEWIPLGGGNVMDTTANMRMMAGDDSDVTIAVVEALRQAGVGSDEPLMLVGHSQGGIAAMALAATPTFTAAFDVRSVVTAGSPVAGFEAPPGVSVLSLENETDVLPALDGVDNADTADWITVRRDLRASAHLADREAAGSFVGSHEIGAYERTGKAFDASGSPSARDWRARNAVFLEGASTRDAYEILRGTDKSAMPSAADAVS